MSEMDHIAKLEQERDSLRERNAELEAQVEELKRALNEMLPDKHAAEQSRDRALSELARATETWTDDKGTVWAVPTAWAYAAACKALEQHKSELAEARKAK